MAATTEIPAPTTEAAAEEALKKRNDWFTTTADPWAEIARLEFGGDRTYASTVNRIVLDAEPAQRPALEKELMTVLGRAELTEAGRLFVCRMLGLIGSAACVAAVAPLLNDERTADVARLALDEIEGTEVDAAYRAALGKLSGAARMGLIGSIARRGDRSAAELLNGIAGDAKESGETREAAERAVKWILERKGE